MPHEAVSSAFLSGAQCHFPPHSYGSPTSAILTHSILAPAQTQAQPLFSLPIMLSPSYPGGWLPLDICVFPKCRFSGGLSWLPHWASQGHSSPHCQRHTLPYFLLHILHRQLSSTFYSIFIVFMVLSPLLEIKLEPGLHSGCLANVLNDFFKSFKLWFKYKECGQNKSVHSWKDSLKKQSFF